MLSSNAVFAGRKESGSETSSERLEEGDLIRKGVEVGVKVEAGAVGEPRIPVSVLGLRMLSTDTSGDGSLSSAEQRVEFMCG